MPESGTDAGSIKMIREGSHTISQSTKTKAPWFGTMIYHLLPYRRFVMLDNLRRVFGDLLPESEIRSLAQANYAHCVRFLLESFRLHFMSPRQRKSWIRLENLEAPLGAQRRGKGIILLTGHFGNFDVSCMAGLVQFPRFRNLFHFVRRPLKPRLLESLIARRFRRAGLGILPKKGSLDKILKLLGRGSIVVYAFDQHAEKRDGVAVDFCGHPRRHVQERCPAGAHDGRGGRAGLQLARARRPPRAAIRRSPAVDRMRRPRRSRPEQHPSL
jgi:KDO2-lipid IV(A) lauroyltransferase